MGQYHKRSVITKKKQNPTGIVACQITLCCGYNNPTRVGNRWPDYISRCEEFV